VRAALIQWFSRALDISWLTQWFPNCCISRNTRTSLCFMWNKKNYFYIIIGNVLYCRDD